MDLWEMDKEHTAFEEKPETDWQRIERGEAPVGEYSLGELSVGVGLLAEFISKRYLEEFIPDGGSKIKMITGRRGSGKSHLLNLLLVMSKNKSFITVKFSAKDIWLHDFKEIYLEIMRQCGIETLLSDCAVQIIKNMGYEPDDIAPDQTFVDYLSEQGEANPVNKKEIRNQLKEMFLDNPRMDNNFAQCMALITGSILGHPMLESTNKQLLLGWLHCDMSVKLIQIRSLGLSPNRINKFNARHMLRSLAEVVRLGGHAGLVISIDDMEILLNRSNLSPVHYTKMRREDSYESIRQLIDEIDSMQYLLFLFGFDRELMDDENYGLKSYQALWMRIQNEVVGQRFNCFADMIDLDRMGAELYTEEALLEMSDKLMRLASENNKELQRPDTDDIRKLLEKSRFESIGLPLALNRRMMASEEENNV